MGRDLHSPDSDTNKLIPPLASVDSMPRVSVVMGSKNDYDCMSSAVSLLKDFGVETEALVVSAHRTPERLFEFSRNAAKRGIEVIIAGAGGAAHLPGMVASMTTLPVIGVPVPSKHLSGIDSLLSIVQMPLGVPVATVAIGNAANAALLAVRILGLSDPVLAGKMEKYMADQTANTLKASLD